MKKVFFICCTLCIIKTGLPQVRLGIKGGINITNQTNAYMTASAGTQPEVLNGKPIVHFTGGVFTEIPVAGHFLVRPQLLVSSEGFISGNRYDMLGNVFATERKYTLNYINLPVQLLYSANMKFGHAWIGTGPYAGVLVNGQYKASSGNLNVNVGSSKDDEYKSFDTGISSSIGLRLNNGLLFDIEQNTGLTDVTPGAPRSRNLAWSFCFGYVIK
ncbi:MAG: porin family protein [Bacteroidota bacterium]|nr:porin family protein [Bacteroidota bacterium]